MACKLQYQMFVNKIFLLVIALASFGFNNPTALPVLSLSEQGLKEISLPPDRGWKYHPGDNPDWSAPDFDDSSWELIGSASLLPGNTPESEWEGIGWFRLHFRPDSYL